VEEASNGRPNYLERKMWGDQENLIDRRGYLLFLRESKNPVVFKPISSKYPGMRDNSQKLTIFEVLLGF